MASAQHHPNPVTGNGARGHEAAVTQRREGIRPLPEALGVASVLLGIPQLATPTRFDRAIGVEDDGASVAWTRVVGVRESTAKLL